ncbi:lysM domain receptor-like kinase 4 [Juglans microcarpa x Juglans regia]|uniref:lysM domain receptor-like kinase 4 n=1 Tax=Juglans microcarpa x Juglans regia TaxID=2249226 RepID=UPI001B7F1AA5|nr:lysM domain receptor-like kinase 4 [Juglans microcarpa x Juglans regia]
MIYLWFLIWVCTSSSYAQQFYDSSSCYSEKSGPGSRYTCNYSQNSCDTFVVYRASKQLQTIADISKSFLLNPDEVLQHNNHTSPSEILKPGREVFVPIKCYCSGQFFQANFRYEVREESTTFSEIACGVFEGLLKYLTLKEANPSNETKVGSELHVPVRCACLDNFTRSIGVTNLVTYPLIEGDLLETLSTRFGIPNEDLLAVNNLKPDATIYQQSTVLIPLKADPVIEFSIPDSDSGSPPPTVFLPTIPREKTSKTSKLRGIYIAGSVSGVFLVVVALVACGLYIHAFKKWKGKNFQSFTAESSPVSCSPVRSSGRTGQTSTNSTISCLSPDLLVGIKYSLFMYSIEELRKATRDFSEESKIGDQVFKGLINNVEVMIKQTRFEDTRRIINLYSKINHINIVSLHGICYGESDFSCSYLVFEFPRNDCLRQCLSNPYNPLQWHRRTQIAFDIATGLHYLHYCTFLSHAHMSLCSRNIFVTANWRAKLANIETNTPSAVPLKGNDNRESLREWVAPEYLHGSTSEKAHIFAFGVVLLELISGREDPDGKWFRESIEFLGGASESGCFEQLRRFVDPSLKDEFSLAEALCLAVLAKACVEDDPLRRPSMDDIMKVLARMA